MSTILAILLDRRESFWSSRLGSPEPSKAEDGEKKEPGRRGAEQPVTAS